VQQHKPAITDGEEMAGCYCPGPVHAYASDEEDAASGRPVVVSPRPIEGVDVARSDDSGGVDDTKETDEPVGTLGYRVSDPPQGSTKEGQQVEDMDIAGAGGVVEVTPSLQMRAAHALGRAFTRCFKACAADHIPVGVSTELHMMPM
jgi:hypothetical protein